MNSDSDPGEDEEDNTLLHHIILPTVLPREALYTTELDLMNQMVNNVKNLTGWIPSETVDLFQKLQKVHTNCTPQTVFTEINKLCPGDTFAMFIRHQHYAIMIHVPSDEKMNDVQNVIVATFPGSLHPSEIYEHDSDIGFNYPERAIKVKFSRMLRSEEFANQLCVLNEVFPFERRKCMSNWLLTLLMDDESTATTVDEFPIITKKIRDEFLGNGEVNFRRSGFYMSIKAMLQHSLTLQMGTGPGKLLYKIVMLTFLIDTCAPYKECDSFNIDLLSQMIAKLARRIEKLSTITIEDNILPFNNIVIGQAKETIKIIRGKIDLQIKKNQEKNKAYARLPALTGLDFESDICYEIKNLQEYFTKRDQMTVKIIEDDSTKCSQNSKRPADIKYDRHFESRPPHIESIDELKSELDHRIFWIDFERMVLYEMKMDDERWPNNLLRTWSFAYAKYAEQKYKNNQLFISRMLLVRLKLIAILDKQATKMYPLLLEHHSGINTNIIDSLLLPQHTDMCIAYEIENYFRDRNRHHRDPSLIDRKPISDISFMVKFAREDPNMEKLRDAILAKDKENVIRKKDEWKKGCEKADTLRSEANRMECEDGRNGHARDCKRCALKREASDLCIKQYEHLLPEDEIEQYAIVFELEIPSSIASLRDVLFGLAIFYCGESKKLKIKSNWIEKLPRNYNNSTSEYVMLGSTVSGKVEKIPVDQVFNKLIVQNACDCVFHGIKRAMPNSSPSQLIKKSCTFEAQDEYVGLQWALQSTQHTENQVLSSQSKCRTDLTLSEYKNFGSLRSDGHRLQIRKLYAMIETEALSFEKESVLALVMQTLWECGVSGEGNSIRESHIDFGDVKFCDAMIELLEKFVKQQRNNWMHPFKLLTATLVAVRAFEINESNELANKMAHLLSHIRSTAWHWIDKIETSIRDMMNPDESTERGLRMKLIYVAIIGGLTFFVHPKHKYYEKIFQTNTEDNECVTWLRFVISLKNNVRMYTNNEEKLPSNLVMFLRLIESVGVSLEEKVTELIEQNEIFALIRKQWPRAEYAIFKEFHFDLEHPQILVVVVTVDSTDQTVTIDIVTGTFLVDDLPISRLPTEIMNSAVYRWFFGDVVFEVQPDAQRSFTTIQKYNECSYEFKMINDNIIITERKVNVFEKELIDQSIFDGEFPSNLVNNYSHWLNKANKCIEFRQKAIGKQHFSKEITIDYRLDVSTPDRCYLIHEQTELPMLDLKSKSFAKITKQLARLEYSKYIHVLYLAATREATVELFRMNLKFTIKCSGKKYKKHSDLISNEFNGMRVSREQNIGTLFGLNHGLILGSDDNARKILLIPNGHMVIRRHGIFPSVTIETKNELQKPPFYQYQVDKFCLQLKSSNGSHASWFYLAYLHAVTSYGQIEPFTGMSGTERALQILQSAYTWSSSPYEAEAVKMLEKFADLTPRRKLEHDMQLITYPQNIPVRSAHDFFIFIAKKLLADSQRLRSLHGDSLAQKIDLDTNLKLNERNHRRCQQLNPNLRVSGSFIEPKVLKTSPPNRNAVPFCDNTRTVCILYHKQQFKLPANGIFLKRFLTGEAHKMLTGLRNKDRIKEQLNHCGQDEFRDLWILLYDAVVKRTLNREQLTVILSFYAVRDENIQAILALQAIATNPIKFHRINPPSNNVFQISSGTYRTTDRQKSKDVQSLLMKYYKEPVEYNTEEWLNTGIKLNHDLTRNTIIDDITTTIKHSWPCDSIEFTTRWKFEYIDFIGANHAINEKLKTWHANYELNKFIKRVEDNLLSLTSGLSRIRVNPCLPQSLPGKWAQTSINFMEKIQENSKTFKQEIEEARDIWEMKKRNSPRSSKEWWEMYKKIANSHETRHLIQADTFPRTVPSLLLPKIIDTQFDYDLKCLIGAYGIAIASEQRENRIKNYKKRQLADALHREETNKPYENWSPCEYPEWLLFEIEQNLTVRRIQIEIAKRMIEPPEIDTKHSVMQLNMGEGKTSVIVPILAARLADGSQACQIIVLKSLFTTNLKSLRQHLGGFLNRRIYIFPCRRDMPIESHAHEILHIYEECKREKGVILTLPEYRLSFQLKIYESISIQLKTDDARNFATARILLEMHKWTNANVRTILDESDAILQAKYQLIYTVGKQMQPDGDSQRWLVVQALLKRVPFHMRNLYDQFGKEKVEFGHSYGAHKDVNHRTDIFTPCRVLDEMVFEALKKLLIDDFLDGRLDLDFPGIDDTKKQSVANLLKNKALDQNAFRSIEDFSAEKQNIIYILSGLLRFEVLKLALTKRWRVNYGVDVRGQRKMAIPFKAKDVAAEMTEFGHTDVAVCFTQMSYYYAGLTDAQLYQVFNILENLPDAANIYAKWIESIPNHYHIPSIVSYKGVNLDDSDQRDQLFPLLRFNMNVIDFWLSRLVFPSELKIFEKKLMCTAWDLCSEHFTHRVTGFSGTNDTKNILPKSITQNDFKELENTNEEMRQILLNPKNQIYEKPGNMSGKQILMELVALKIPVLLDSGALMLELNNKQVAVEWLKLTTVGDAAVYFDEHDTLQTIDRNDIVVELDYSVYREDLSKCVVYLDDAHTRGTDLKFPPDWKACVTLSGDITRDKTVQSCMRMRQLATTQSILFWASIEADIRLRELSAQRKVKIEHVMAFIENNSQRFETANMVHWTTGAVNYTKKLIGHELYANNIDEKSLEQLYHACVDDDFVKLSAMFGEKKEALLSEITFFKFGKFAFANRENREIRKKIEAMKTHVVDKLDDRAPDVKRFTHALDEEQEKELEQEIEEQIQVERPPDAKPANPKFDKRLEQLVLAGGTIGTTFNDMKTDGTLLSIVASLSNTQMFAFCENNEDAWADHLLVTKDFQTVVDSQLLACNDFLRPVCWIACINNDPTDKNILILLSSFECNRLLPAFRKSINSTLFMYRPRLSNLHSNLLCEAGLQLTGMATINSIGVEDEVQIGVYSGLMYFGNEIEQNAYCRFLGLIPRPWTRQQEMAYADGIIDENGFVPIKKRNYPEAITLCNNECKFKNNPTDLTIRLIKAHHQMLPKDSHAASILNRGIKALGGDEAMQID